jgi:putative transposase
MTVVSELTLQFGVAAACQALAVPRSSFYRSRQVPSPKVSPLSPPARSPRALSEEEQSVVRETLNSPRFVDQAPREVYATLLDEERYLCSWRTMYVSLRRGGVIIPNSLLYSFIGSQFNFGGSDGYEYSC